VLRVLVVDDVADTAESVSLLLSAWGHEPHVANDGQSAVALAARVRPDVALVDVAMPGMDGFEVARRLRATPGLEKALLVAITGLGREEDRRRCLAAGFDLHLLKPVDPEELERLLARRTRQNGQGPCRRLVAPVRRRLPLRCSSPTSPTPSRGRLMPTAPPRVLVVEDNADARESLCLLLSLSGYEAREAPDGAEGLRLALGWRPDAVISDIGMPGLDGWQVARQVRRALGVGVLLIAVSGYCADEDRARSLAAGFDHHLGKPPDPGKLLRLLPRAC
jgi:CheY-like chemotaxis protein